MLISSNGAAQEALTLMGRWAYQHKVCFHSGPGKTVSVVPANGFQPVLFQVVVGRGHFRLCVKESHKWLGLPWPGDLNFLPAVLKHVAIADSIVNNIVGLLQSGLPLVYGLRLFEAKVDGFLRFGRWLLAMADTAQVVYEQAYERLAKLLLGVPAWRSPYMACLECGWTLTGSRRSVVDVAMRKARLFLLPASDSYRALFSFGAAGNSKSS